MPIPIRAWGHIGAKVYGLKEKLVEKPKTCEKCFLKCRVGGVEIHLEEGISMLEIISHNNPPIQLVAPKLNMTQLFDEETVSSPYIVTATAWHGGKLLKTLKIECPTAPYCETLGCAWCWRLVSNSPCAPYFSAIALAFYVVGLLLLLVVALLVVAVVLVVIFKAGRKCFSFLLYGRRTKPAIEFALPKLSKIVKKGQKMKANLTSKKQPKKSMPSPTAPPPSPTFQRSSPLFSPSTALIIALLITGRLEEAAGCAETRTFAASEENCLLNIDNTMRCVFNNVTVVEILPRGQEICFLTVDKENRPVGHLKLKAEGVEYKCEPSTYFFSRDVEYRDVSRKRCNGKGSCTRMRVRQRFGIQKSSN